MVHEIQEAVAFLQKQKFQDPEFGIILGTGLGNSFIQELTVEVEVNYKDIPHFPEATVESHHGKLLFGTIAGKKVVAMQGRFHYYEGHSMQEVTLPVRVMKVLGVSRLIISNAAGNLNMDWNKGELMLLDDHINLQPENPLRGENISDWGPRFPDMSAPYDVSMNGRLEQIAKEMNVPLRKGVYAAVEGPNLETRAEYRYLQRIGADAVGMSTVPEVIVANHMGLPCVAISVLTDNCDPDNLTTVDIRDILAIAARAEVVLTQLIVGLIRIS